MTRPRLLVIYRREKAIIGGIVADAVRFADKRRACIPSLPGQPDSKRKIAAAGMHLMITDRINGSSTSLVPSMARDHYIRNHFLRSWLCSMGPAGLTVEIN